MISLEKKYKLVLTKHNFNDPFMSASKVFKTYPTEEEIIEAITKMNEESPNHARFKTTAMVEEFFDVTIITYET